MPNHQPTDNPIEKDPNPNVPGDVEKYEALCQKFKQIWALQGIKGDDWGHSLDFMDRFLAKGRAGADISRGSSEDGRYNCGR